MSVSASIGPISGIDYGKLITGLTGPEQSAIDAITTRTTALDQQNTALMSLSTMMTALKISAASFTSSAIFRAATATSNNPNVINATAGIGTPVGNYTFNVQRLASASQMVTQGFADATNTPLGLSGNITLQLGGGALDRVASLNQLNGGGGVARGNIRITDRSGASSLIDLTHAVDINDVVNALNSATGVAISAKVEGDHLVLTDNSGGTGSLTVTNAGGTTTASDLGLAGTSSTGTLTGTSLSKLTATTSLDSLNDGNGVRTAGILTDFTITGSTGIATDVSLNNAKSIGDVVKAINTESQKKSAGITAAISADGTGITLTDSGSGPINVTAQNSSLAAYDLGILGTSSAGTLAGDRITSALTGPLLRDLNGGNQGQTGYVPPQPGTITINGQSVDLTNARSLNDVLAAINNSSSGVTAALDNAGTGITLSSTATSFTVADGTGNLASFLQIAGTSSASATGSQIGSGNLHLQYVSQNTLLSDLNGGAGFKAGSITVTDGTGKSQVVNLSGGNVTTVGDVIHAINNAGLALTAGINSTGDGILLNQTAGTGNATIADSNQTGIAASLGIAGVFSNNQLNGSFQKSITIAVTDKLSDIANKINSLNAGVAASVINDGSGSTPYRLNLSSRNSGAAGRLIFDGSALGLNMTQLVQAQDAVVVYGGNANGTGGLTSMSSSNAITGLVPSLTLNLTGVGTTSVSVTNDTSRISDSVQSFVDNYNKVINAIADDTKFDPNNATNNGVLFGSSIAQQVENALGSFITRRYTTAGPLTSLQSIGISVAQDGTLNLDTNKLDQILVTNADDVRSLFTTNVPAVTGGPQTITSATKLSSLTTAFSPGHISITDAFGTKYDVDLTSASTIGDVTSKINTATGGKVMAGINATGDGLILSEFNGTGTPTTTASVSEVGGGNTAASLNILGTLTGGTLNRTFPPILPKGSVKGVGATLSDLIDRYSNAQTGLIFQSADAITTQEQQLKDRQTSLASLLIQKRNQMIRQFANLEVTIASLQQQGSAIANFKPIATTTSSSTSSGG